MSAVNQNGLVVTRTTATAYGLRRTSDLIPTPAELVIGGPPAITVWNSGRVAISELTVDLLAVDGLVYRIDDLNETFRSIAPVRERLALREQLIPDGRASLRIKPCLLAYVDAANLGYSKPDARYRLSRTSWCWRRGWAKRRPCRARVTTPAS